MYIFEKLLLSGESKMKKLIVFLCFIIVVFQLNATETDTAWTRQILGEDILDVKFSPDGSMIATGHEDPENKSKAKIRLWDTQTGEVLKELETGTSFTTCLVFSEDGSYLFSGHEKGRLFRWDMQTFEKSENLLANYPDYLHPNSVAITSLVYSDLNSKLIVGTTQNNNGSTNPNNIFYLDELTGQIIKDLKLKGSVSKLIINKDENYFAAKSTFYQNPTRYYQVTLFDLNTFEEIKVLDDTPFEILDIQFSPDGYLLYESIASPNENLNIWDVESQELIRTLKPIDILALSQFSVFKNNYLFVFGGTPDFKPQYGIYDIVNNIFIHKYNIIQSGPNSIDISFNQNFIACGIYSNLYIFNNVLTDVSETEYSSLKDTIIPNPTENTATININFPTSGQVIFILSDINGAEIGTILENYFEAGNHEIDIQLPNLPSGNYFLTVNGEKYSKTFKLSIVK